MCDSINLNKNVHKSNLIIHKKKKTISISHRFPLHSKKRWNPQHPILEFSHIKNDEQMKNYLKFRMSIKAE